MRIVQDHPQLAGAAILVASIAINAALYWMAVRNYPERDVAENVVEAIDRPLMEMPAQMAPPSIRIEPPTFAEPAEPDNSHSIAQPSGAASDRNGPAQEKLSPSGPETRRLVRAKAERSVRPRARKIRRQADRRQLENYLSLEALPSRKSALSSDFENVL